MKRTKKSLKAYANFLFEAGVLARTPRAGFRHLGNWKQSVAEHLCRTAYVGFVLAHLEQEKGEEVSVEKVMECCLFHDFGEARAIDLDYISQKYSKTDELKAIQDAVKISLLETDLLMLSSRLKRNLLKRVLLPKMLIKLKCWYLLKRLWMMVINKPMLGYHHY